nr:hypothetical protein CFP56_34118 [Quercus suber]
MELPYWWPQDKGCEKVAQTKHSHQWSRDKGQWNRCAAEAYPRSEEGRRTTVLEFFGHQDKKDKMVDLLEIEAWLMQYQLL